jgi:hypothetical protein
MGLELAYGRARDIIGQERAECLDGAEEVEQLRSAWKPERVRIVVLAESHVWTSREETRSRVKQPDGRETGFARFVYCLGYGERQLVEPEVRRNVGTPQYWKLFHDTLCEPTLTSNKGVMKTGERDRQQRVRNKLDLLNKMQGAGVWLIDASVTALVREGKMLVAPGDYRAVLNACWETHIREVLIECKPSLAAVLIVGRGVDDAIGDTVRRDLGDAVKIQTINQPNYPMSRDAIACNRRQCFDLCCRHRA